MNLEKKIRYLNHKRIDFFRKIKLKLSVLLFSPFSRRCVFSNENSILILRLDGKLGDSICATGFLREIKKQNPSSKLMIVCSSVSYQIYSRIKFIDHCYIVDKGFISLMKCFIHLTKYKFKYIINTSHILNPRTLFLVSFLCSNRKVGFENFDVKIFTDSIKINFSEHITERLALILKTIGCEYEDLSYEFNIDHTESKKIKDYFQDINPEKKPIVIINSFAGARLRNFSQTKTIKIIELILNKLDVIIVSIANEGDHEILKKWIGKSYEKKWHHNPELCTIDSNIALVQQADLIITPDTAWVHIASCLNKKVICVFRKDNVFDVEKNSLIWSPLNSLSKVIYSRPESDYGYDANDINSFDEQEILDVACQLLGKS
jgi:ADP-heptose:LPS heptosyltransferase